MEVVLLKQDDLIKAQLVCMGWRWSQAYSGGHVAGELVMSTLANRTRCGWGSWLQVIDSVPKYMAENELPPLSFPSVWEPAFVKLLHSVDGIYDGSVPDKSKGALYWGELNKIERPWFKALIAATNPTIIEDGSGVELRQHPIVANINSLTFFR